MLALASQLVGQCSTSQMIAPRAKILSRRSASHRCESCWLNRTNQIMHRAPATSFLRYGLGHKCTAGLCRTRLIALSACGARRLPTRHPALSCSQLANLLITVRQRWLLQKTLLTTRLFGPDTAIQRGCVRCWTYVMVNGYSVALGSLQPGTMNLAQ